MFEGLLKYSMDRISSLEHYYEVEAKNVIQVSEDGKREHKLGAMIDTYLESLVCSNKQEQEAEPFKQFERDVLKHIKVIDSFVDENVNKIIYRFLSEEDAIKAGKIKEESGLYKYFADMPLIHGSSTLMMVVTRFEEFISNYLVELYTQFPQKYLDNQLLTFSEISSANIMEIKNNLVLREVDKKMRESFTEWFKIYNSHGMTCKLFENDLSVLSEIYARRNIIVHNSGIVNPTYLRAVPDSNCKLGEKLSVDETYMKTVFETVYRIIILMLIESSKLNKKNEEKYLLNVFNLLFDYMLRGKYRVCEPAFAELYKKEGLNSEYKLMSKFNRWICVIAENGLSQVEEEIREYDVSALNDIFKLAKATLLNEYETSNDLLSKLLKSEEINPTIVEEWPLFMWYRSSDYYSKLKEDLPEKFGLEREEVTEQKCNDPEDTTLFEDKKPIVCI